VPRGGRTRPLQGPSSGRKSAPTNFRVFAFGGLQQGAGFPYQQQYLAAGLGCQFKPILKSHFENIDPDKEHHLVIGGGYEFFRTIQSGKTKDERRVIFEAIPGFRPSSRFLVRDTNRVEFRWVNGVYSTRYRNKLRVERDFLFHGLRARAAERRAGCKRMTDDLRHGTGTCDSSAPFRCVRTFPEGAKCVIALFCKSSTSRREES